MLRKMSCVVGVLFTIALLAYTPVSARMLADPKPYDPGSIAATPAYCLAEHNVGKLVMAVNNNGTFGVSYAKGRTLDCFTGATAQACEYPKGSNTTYMYGAAFWIGAVVGRDTLVSVGADGWQSDIYEMYPDEAPVGNMIFRSSIDPAKPEYDGSVSEQDYIATYTDTLKSGVKEDYMSGLTHRPLHIEVVQRSYAWSYEYAEDFILFDYSIRNIGRDRLTKVYMGIYVDADVCVTSAVGNVDDSGFTDDLTGFREKAPATYLPANCPLDSDVVNIAWITDNNGDLNDGPPLAPVPAITATRIVRTPIKDIFVSYNWWVGNGEASLDWGPQTKAKKRTNLSKTVGTSGTPEGDKNKYWFMSNREFDFDQIRTASIRAVSDSADSIWTPPSDPRLATDLADGYDTRYLLSFGPFTIEPGQTLPLSFAYIAGDNFHREASNINNLPGHTQTADWRDWYLSVSFTDLDKNSTWADWIYDNPGVDTDSDGYFGEFDTCPKGGGSTYDTVWRKGDGVPDFRGATPPPSPATTRSGTDSSITGIRVYPTTGSVHVVWNGLRSENTRDIFSREYDFEGYRVYCGRDDRNGSYTMYASYDLEDYNRYTWDSAVADFRLLESPFTLDSLRTLYSGGDSLWHPLDYSRTRPLIFTDSVGVHIYYFEPQDYNRSIFGNDSLHATTPIRKMYPDAPKPTVMTIDSIPDSLYDQYVTEDGFFKYYEYEYTITDLLPSVPFWINVTAFDYGSPRSGLKSLESSRTVLPEVTYALPSTGDVARDNLKVYVYPNPYRYDENYQARGFEGRGENKGVDRMRDIHFANLPPKCTIKIFSLDGDLVRELTHDVDPADPLANHDTWDMITRNTQLVVSGLYYWTVEDDQGNTQVGKLVIIM